MKQVTKKTAEKILDQSIPEDMLEDGNMVSYATIQKLRRVGHEPKRKLIVSHHIKGGTGKTTFATTMAVGLASKGWKVLLIDTDPSGNSTAALRHSREDTERTLFDIFKEECTFDEAAVRSIEGLPLDLIPCNGSFLSAAMWMTLQNGSDIFLRRLLNTDDCADYDFIVVDSTPGWSVMHANTYMVAEQVVVPVVPEYFSVGDIELLKTCVAKLLKDYDLPVPSIHIIPNNFNLRLDVHRDALQIMDDDNLPYALDSLGKITIPQDAQLKTIGADVEPFIIVKKSRARKPLERLITFLEKECYGE